MELSPRFASSNYIYLKQMQLPHTLKKLNKQTFQSANIEHINLPPLINRIPKHCFFDSLIKTIDLSNIKYIDAHAFSECNDLKKIDLSNVETIDVAAFSSCKELITAILPNNLTTISSHLFYKCDKLKNINFPDNVEKIEKFAFTGTLIEKLELPSSLEKIEQSAFENCRKIKEFKAPINLKYIGPCAFYDCIGLTDITINKKIATIHAEAFSETQIKKVELPSGIEYYSDTFPKFTEISFKNTHNFFWKDR